MKKAIDIIFFIFYNNQYRDGRSNVNRQPWVRALGLLIGGTMAWVLLLFEFYFSYILKRTFTSNIEFYMLLICGILFLSLYNTYIKDKKYEAIYAKYTYLNISRKLNVVFVLFYILSPTIMFMLIALISQHRI